MADEKTIVVPDAPDVLPEELQKQWQSTYTKAFKTAQAQDENAGVGECHQAARIEANRLLTVQAPQSYAEAMSLPAWQILNDSRQEKDAVLRLVTIDGHKYSFDVPKKAGKDTTQKPASA